MAAFIFVVYRIFRTLVPEVRAPAPPAKVYLIDSEYQAATAWRGEEMERMRAESTDRLIRTALSAGRNSPDGGGGMSRLEKNARKAEARVERERAESARAEARLAKERAELAQVQVQLERVRAQATAAENEAEWRAAQDERARTAAALALVVVDVPDPEPPTPEVVSAPSDFAAVPIYFKPGEPTTFEEYGMQRQVTEYLRASIDGLGPDEASIGNYLFAGPPGLGKTTLAKIITNELRHRNLRAGRSEPDFIEVFPVDIEDTAKLDGLMRRAVERPGSVFFIDEVHDLTDRHAYKLYLTLAEQRYKFAEDEHPTALPPVTFLAATTDVGLMHAALRRRFEIMHLAPVGRDEIERAVLMRPFRIEPDAVELLVARTHFCGAPWESLQVFEQSKKFAKAEGRDRISVDDVGRVFALNGIDDLGLSSIDRKVVEVLFTQPKHRRGKAGGLEFVAFGCSEENLCLMAKLDRSQWREVVMPKLMSRGLLSTRTGIGRVLTPEAETRYAYLQPK